MNRQIKREKYLIEEKGDERVIETGEIEGLRVKNRETNRNKRRVECEREKMKRKEERERERDGQH